MSFQKIVVALDDSDRSHAVFSVALDLARRTAASLKLFYGISGELMSQAAALSQESGLYPTSSMTTGFQAGQTELILQQNERSQVLLQPYLQAAQQAGLVVDTEVKMGDVGTIVCQIAKDWSADLIVIGRRGRSGLSEVLLGSVSNYVLHHAACSVLIVQGRDE